MNMVKNEIPSCPKRKAAPAGEKLNSLITLVMTQDPKLKSIRMNKHYYPLVASWSIDIYLYSHRYTNYVVP